MGYAEAIREAFEYLLSNYPEVFVIGQGLWSPWYVGDSMTNLDKKFGKDRVIDTPVSESACTGLAVGASIAGMKPIIVHPRMDFLLYGLDSIVNEAAKWSYMFGGQASAGLTVRAIINRGGEQGAQHSQALHSWFAHIPGLRVVMPHRVSDARDLLIASVLSPDPVIYIDDRWLYDSQDDRSEITLLDLKSVGPLVVREGLDLTIVGSGFSVKLALETATLLQERQIDAEVIDLRILNPFDPEVILKSVMKTGRLLVVDGGWKTSGFAAEVITSVVEQIDPKYIKTKPQRVVLPSAPAPASKTLEAAYYPSVTTISAIAMSITLM